MSLQPDLVKLVERASASEVAELEKLLARVKLEHLSPTMDKGEAYKWGKFANGFVLKNYQAMCATRMVNSAMLDIHGIRGLILKMSMGLGKTLTLAAALQKLQGPHLFVCESTPLTTMASELVAYYGTEYRVFCLHEKMIGELFYRFNADTPGKNHIVLTTYDVVSTLAASCGVVETKRKAGKRGEQRRLVGEAFFGTKWASCCLDEVQTVSTPTTQKYKACKAIDSDVWYGLSSTPIRGNEDSLFAILRLFGLNYKGALNASVYQKLGLHRLLVSISKEDVRDELGLPGMEKRRVLVELTQNEKNLYNFMRRIGVDLIEQYKAKKVTRMGVMQMMIRQRQICVAPHLMVKGKELPPGEVLGEKHLQQERWLREHDDSKYFTSRFNKVVELVRGYLRKDITDKCIVFSEWVGPLELLQKRLEYEFKGMIPLVACGKTSNLDMLLERFKTESKCAVLLMNKKIGAKALTLVEANHVIILEVGYDPSVDEQCGGRIHRIGQKKKCTLDILYTPRSLDEIILEQCANKVKRNSKFIENLPADVMKKLLDAFSQLEA